MHSHLCAHAHSFNQAFSLTTTGLTPKLRCEASGEDAQYQVCEFPGRLQHKVPRPGWLKTTEACSLTVLDAKSLKSRCEQGRFLLEAFLVHKDKQSYSFTAGCSKRVNHGCLHFGRNSRTGRGVGKLYRGGGRGMKAQIALRSCSKEKTGYLWTFFARKNMCVACMLHHVQLFATPWTVAHQASLSTGFPKQEYWSG